MQSLRVAAFDPFCGHDVAAHVCERHDVAAAANKEGARVGIGAEARARPSRQVASAPSERRRRPGRTPGVPRGPDRQGVHTSLVLL